MADGEVARQSKAFSVRIVNLYKYLRDVRNEYVMSKQVLRSGTSIAANIAEATYGASRADFINRMRIALKEANETRYWLELLHSTGHIDDTPAKSILNDCKSIIYLLISIINSSEGRK